MDTFLGTPCTRSAHFLHRAVSY